MILLVMLVNGGDLMIIINPTYNIEFCHIYSDKLLLDNSICEGLIQAKRIITQLEHQDISYVLTILIDNYPGSKLNIKKLNLFLDELKKYNIQPNYVFDETSLTNMAEKVISEIPPKWKKEEGNKINFVNFITDINLKEEIEENDRDSLTLFLEEADFAKSYKENKNENIPPSSFSEVTLSYKENGNINYSCTLLTVCWHLFRLGLINGKKEIKPIINSDKKLFFGKKTITILPKRYMLVEANSMEILNFLPKKYKKARKKIEHFFY